MTVAAFALSASAALGYPPDYGPFAPGEESATIRGSTTNRLQALASGRWTVWRSCVARG
jgi:hypothetical protein